MIMSRTHADATVPPDSFPKLGLGQVIALHLAPGAVAFGVAIAVAPLLGRLHLPENFAVTVSFVIALAPIELGLLLRARRASAGHAAPRRLASVIAYRERIGRRWWLIPLLFLIALGIALAWSPVADAIGDSLRGLLPNWLAPDYDPADHASKGVLIAVILVTLLVDGFVNPVVEELYFRGYLLPRIPLAIRPAVGLSAFLFAIQHFWQPYNWG